MIRTILPPRPPEPVRPPMIYVERNLVWEYNVVSRNLETEQPPGKNELDALGIEGWEMCGIVQHGAAAHYYFKRMIEK